MARKKTAHIPYQQFVPCIDRKEKNAYMLHADTCKYCGKRIAQTEYALRLQTDVLAQFAPVGEAMRLFPLTEKELCVAAALCGYQSLYGVKQSRNAKKNITESVKKALQNLEKMRAAEISVSGEAKIDAQLAACLRTYCETPQLTVYKIHSPSYGKHTFYCTADSEQAVVLVKTQHTQYALFQLNSAERIRAKNPQNEIRLSKAVFLQARAQIEAFDTEKAQSVLSEYGLTSAESAVVLAVLLQNTSVCMCNTYDTKTGQLQLRDSRVLAETDAGTAEIQFTDM